jgi:hypothetical protein
MMVDAAMDEAERRCGDKAKAKQKQAARQRALDEYLYSAREEAPTKGRFRDPASVVRRGR